MKARMSKAMRTVLADPEASRGLMNLVVTAAKPMQIGSVQAAGQVKASDRLFSVRFGKVPDAAEVK